MISERTQKILEFDLSFNLSLVCGIDEVGRGPLAGPVVAAAVILPLDRPIDCIFDSKKISKAKREMLAEKILSTAVCYKIVEIDNLEIDRINILQATIKCMQKCIDGLSRVPDLILIDAVKGLDSGCKVLSIAGGDNKSYNIAAASIAAKVHRDKIMLEYAKKYPEYGFEKNAGYGTKAHLDAIKKHGLTPIHRKSFCRNYGE